MRELKNIKGHFVEEGTICQGKKVRPGIFVNITGKTEREKLFDLAKREIGIKAREFDLYEIIDL